MYCCWILKAPLKTKLSYMWSVVFCVWNLQQCFQLTWAVQFLYSVHLSVGLFVCLSIHLSIHISIRKPKPNKCRWYCFILAVSVCLFTSIFQHLLFQFSQILPLSWGTLATTKSVKWIHQRKTHVPCVHIGKRTANVTIVGSTLPNYRHPRHRKRGC